MGLSILHGNTFHLSIVWRSILGMLLHIQLGDIPTVFSEGCFLKVHKTTLFSLTFCFHNLYSFPFLQLCLKALRHVRDLMPLVGFFAKTCSSGVFLFTDLFCGSVLQLPCVSHTSCFHLRDLPSYLLFHQQGHRTGHRAPSLSPTPLELLQFDKSLF